MKYSKEQYEKAIREHQQTANDLNAPEHIQRNARLAIIILKREMRERFGNGDIS